MNNGVSNYSKDYNGASLLSNSDSIDLIGDFVTNNVEHEDFLNCEESPTEFKYNALLSPKQSSSKKLDGEDSLSRIDKDKDNILRAKTSNELIAMLRKEEKSSELIETPLSPDHEININQMKADASLQKYRNHYVYVNNVII